MSLLRGILHVHSTFSYDGRHTLAEIAALARERGYQFVGMSEHSNTLDDANVAALIETCKQVSTADCLILPGIEFTCRDNLHLLAFGIAPERHFTEHDPAEVARWIQAEGGVAVVAHPVRYDYQIPDAMAPYLDGIEIWNAGYDGRFIPNDSSYRLLARLRKDGHPLHGFGGQDLHRITTNSHVVISVDAEMEVAAIRNELKAGRFTVSNRYFELKGDRPPGPIKMAQIRWMRRAYEAVKRPRNDG